MIKRCCLLGLFVVIAFGTKAQVDFKDFYRSHKHRAEVKNFLIPGWLFWVGSGLVYNGSRNDEDREWLVLARKMGSIRLMLSENKESLPAASISDLAQNLQQNGYDQLVYLRQDGSEFDILGKEGPKGRLKELVVLGHDEEQAILLSGKTRIRMKDFSRLIEHYMLDGKPKAKSKKPKRIPQV
jgi:Domain of unknown function (DUF4252)